MTTATQDVTITSALSDRTYNKPIWFEEYWYENTTCDNEYVKGIRITHRAFGRDWRYPITSKFRA